LRQSSFQLSPYALSDKPASRDSHSEIIVNNNFTLQSIFGHATLVGPGPDRNASGYSSDGVYASFRDQGFFVIRKGKEIFALSALCTHRKCKLSSELDRSFYCKCHGSAFDPNGKVTEGPAQRDLPILTTVTNEKGHLLVRVPIA
jgi:Rieske Fe-S protein